MAFDGIASTAPKIGGWRGSRSPDELPHLDITLCGMEVDAGMIKESAVVLGDLERWEISDEGHSGVRIVLLARTGKPGAPWFSFTIRSAVEADGSETTADFAIAVGGHRTAPARRHFIASDATVALAFVTRFISALNTNTRICIDLADFLWVWAPENVHHIAWITDYVGSVRNVSGGRDVRVLTALVLRDDQGDLPALMKSVEHNLVRCASQQAPLLLADIRSRGEVADSVMLITSLGKSAAT